MRLHIFSHNLFSALPAIVIASLALLTACHTGGDTSEFNKIGRESQEESSSIPSEAKSNISQTQKTRVDAQPNDNPEDDILSVKEILAKYKGSIKSGPRYHDRIRINSIGRLADVFNDSNYVQLMYANALGIKPIHSLKDAWHTRRPMIHIKSNEYYLVDSLTHSLPFLVPEAALLLKRVSANFIDSLGARGADGYRVKVTSLLRTPSTVKRLRRVNVNATDSSTHQFGTTFDLSYVKFACSDTTRTINEEDLKNLLGEVLLDLRNSGRCLVKFERKTGCYHVTATR